jgi:endonuclease-3
MFRGTQPRVGTVSEDAEPRSNIAGGPGGGEETVISLDTPQNRATKVVQRLGDLYWTKTYGGRGAFECLVRTILSQNTSDAASQPAHDALIERFAQPRGSLDLAQALAPADRDVIADTIRPAGLYNRKAGHIQCAAKRILSNYGSSAAFGAFVCDAPAETVRETLLDMDGVGPKTADCVLLFAGGREGVFPVDTHVHRLYRRLGVVPADADHEEVRQVLETTIPDEACGFGHTASIQFGREYCTARQPACLDGEEDCPLANLCAQRGVDHEMQSVVDPAEAPPPEEGPRDP